jgi:hypothetical protein
MKMLDWGIAKSIEFDLVEIVRFVPNLPPQAQKHEIMLFLCHCDTEKCECDVILQKHFAKNSKNRILQDQTKIAIPPLHTHTPTSPPNPRICLLQQ